VDADSPSTLGATAQERRRHVMIEANVVALSPDHLARGSFVDHWCRPGGIPSDETSPTGVNTTLWAFEWHWLPIDPAVASAQRPSRSSNEDLLVVQSTRALHLRW